MSLGFFDLHGPEPRKLTASHLIVFSRKVGGSADVAVLGNTVIVFAYRYEGGIFSKEDLRAVSVYGE